MYKLIIETTIEGFDGEKERVDEEVFVSLSSHARKRMRERAIDKHTIYGSVLSMGERLLEFSCGQEFIIIDRKAREAVVGSIDIDDGRIIIDIITAIDTNYVFKKEGQKVLLVS